MRGVQPPSTLAPPFPLPMQTHYITFNHWLSFTMVKYNAGAMEVGHALCAAKNIISLNFQFLPIYEVQ